MRIITGKGDDLCKVKEGAASITIRGASVLELREKPRLETPLPQWPPDAQGANHQGFRFCAVSPRSVRQRKRISSKLEIELLPISPLLLLFYLLLQMMMITITLLFCWYHSCCCFC